jgi:hypothetical protein
MFGEPTVQFLRQFGREWERLIWSLFGDGIPQIFDELQTLGDRKLSELIEIQGAFRHTCNVNSANCSGKRDAVHANALASCERVK